MRGTMFMACSSWNISLQAYGNCKVDILSGDFVDGQTAWPCFASK